MAGDKSELRLPFIEENLRYETGTVQHDVALIIKDMLLSDVASNDDVARATAYQLNAYYWERNKESGPFFKWAETGEPVPSFISFVIDIIIESAPKIPYNDVKQDLLVQLHHELRNLPPNPVKAWNKDRLVPPEEMELGDVLHQTWTALWVPDNKAYPDPAEWQQYCNEWVNFSAFLARCIQAGVDKEALLIGKYPSTNINDALNSYIADEVKRNSWVMVAAQYILLAGPAIDQEFIGMPEAQDWATGKWQSWAEGFKKVAEMELAPNVKEAVIEARKKIIAMKPELFPVSEGGSKPDTGE